jgi:hypothetical protein
MAYFYPPITRYSNTYENVYVQKHVYSDVRIDGNLAHGETKAIADGYNSFAQTWTLNTADYWGSYSYSGGLAVVG